MSHIAWIGMSKHHFSALEERRAEYSVIPQYKEEWAWKQYTNATSFCSIACIESTAKLSTPQIQWSEEAKNPLNIAIGLQQTPPSHSTNRGNLVSMACSPWRGLQLLFCQKLTHVTFCLGKQKKTHTTHSPCDLKASLHWLPQLYVRWKLV
jgi:hypothetical protein